MHDGLSDHGESNVHRSATISRCGEAVKPGTSGGLTRPQGDPLGSCGEYMAMVWAIAMGDMGTGYELRKKGSCVLGDIQHTMSWVGARCGG